MDNNCAGGHKTTASYSQRVVAHRKWRKRRRIWTEEAWSYFMAKSPAKVICSGNREVQWPTAACDSEDFNHFREQVVRIREPEVSSKSNSITKLDHQFSCCSSSQSSLKKTTRDEKDFGKTTTIWLVVLLPLWWFWLKHLLFQPHQHQHHHQQQKQKNQLEIVKKFASNSIGKFSFFFSICFSLISSGFSLNRNQLKQSKKAQHVVCLLFLASDFKWKPNGESSNLVIEEAEGCDTKTKTKTKTKRVLLSNKIAASTLLMIIEKAKGRRRKSSFESKFRIKTSNEIEALYLNLSSSFHLNRSSEKWNRRKVAEISRLIGGVNLIVDFFSPRKKVSDIIRLFQGKGKLTSPESRPAKVGNHFRRRRRKSRLELRLYRNFYFGGSLFGGKLKLITPVGCWCVHYIEQVKARRRFGNPFRVVWRKLEYYYQRRSGKTTAPIAPKLDDTLLVQRPNFTAKIPLIIHSIVSFRKISYHYKQLLNSPRSLLGINQLFRLICQPPLLPPLYLTPNGREIEAMLLLLLDPICCCLEKSVSVPLECFNQFVVHNKLPYNWTLAEFTSEEDREFIGDTLTLIDNNNNKLNIIGFFCCVTLLLLLLHKERHKTRLSAEANEQLTTMVERGGEEEEGERKEFYDYICIDCHHEQRQTKFAFLLHTKEAREKECLQANFVGYVTSCYSNQRSSSSTTTTTTFSTNNFQLEFTAESSVEICNGTLLISLLGQTNFSSALLYLSLQKPKLKLNPKLLFEANLYKQPSRFSNERGPISVVSLNNTGNYFHWKCCHYYYYCHWSASLWPLAQVECFKNTPFKWILFLYLAKRENKFLHFSEAHRSRFKLITQTQNCHLLLSSSSISTPLEGGEGEGVGGMRPRPPAKAALLANGGNVTKVGGQKYKATVYMLLILTAAAHHHHLLLHPLPPLDTTGGRWFPVAAAAASVASPMESSLGWSMAPSIIDTDERHWIRPTARTKEASSAAAESQWTLFSKEEVAKRRLKRPSRPSSSSLSSDSGSSFYGEPTELSGSITRRGNKIQNKTNHLLSRQHHFELHSNGGPKPLTSMKQEAATKYKRKGELNNVDDDDDDDNNDKRKLVEALFVKFSSEKVDHFEGRQLFGPPKRSKSNVHSERKEIVVVGGGKEGEEEEGKRAKKFDSKRNLFLVYGHNNIDRAQFSLFEEKRGNKLIAASIQPNGQKEPQTQFYNTTSSLGGDKIANGFISNSEVHAFGDRRSLLRGVKNRLFPPPTLASSSSFSSSRRDPNLTNCDSNRGSLLEVPRTPTNRIERKPFRVKTRNDVAPNTNNKDIALSSFSAEDPDDLHWTVERSNNKERTIDRRPRSTSGPENPMSSVSAKLKAANWSSSGLGADNKKLLKSFVEEDEDNNNNNSMFKERENFFSTFEGISITTQRKANSGHEQSSNLSSSLLSPPLKHLTTEQELNRSEDIKLEEEEEEKCRNHQKGRIIGRRHAFAFASEGGGKNRKLLLQPLERGSIIRRAIGHKPHTTYGSSSSQMMAAAVAAAQAAAVASQRGSGNSDNLPSGSAQRLCPNHCTCLWKNGKHFADCSNQQSQQTQTNGKLPNGFDPLLQVLNYSSNYLPDLPDNAFVTLNLNNLQRVYLSNCQLETIQSRAFHNLKLIVELDFSWNKLRFVPLPQMKQLTLLRRLIMRGNPLYALNEATFSGGLTGSGGKQAAPKKGNEQNLFDESEFGNELNDDADDSDRKWWRRQARRLFETYPELMGQLMVQHRRQEQLLLVGNSLDVDYNFIIRTSGNADPNDGSEGNHAKSRQQTHGSERSLFEALDWWLQQDELASNSGSSSSSISYLSGPNVGGELEDELALDNNELPIAGSSSSLGSNGNVQPTLGDHFNHLQELDFGQCKLTYIKWSAFERLNQLKRLLLDGNLLSQLSGKLVATLPIGLHQLSLEENPWKCDCRLLSLKRWLLATRIPLNAPVRCHSTSGTLTATNQQHSSAIIQEKEQQQQQREMIAEQEQINRRPTWRRSTKKLAPLGGLLQPSSSSSELSSSLDRSVSIVAETSNNNDDNMFSSSPNNNDNWNQVVGQSSGRFRRVKSSSSQEYYLNELALDDFVCAPRALKSTVSQLKDAKMSSLSFTWTTRTKQTKHTVGQMVQQHNSDGHHFPLPSLETVFRYLEPTLIRPTNGVEQQQQRQLNETQLNLRTTSSNYVEGAAAAADHLTSSKQPQYRELIQAKEGERVTLNCSLLAYTESSLDIIWLVDYNHHSSASMLNGAQQIHRSQTSSSSQTEPQSSSSSSSSSTVLLDQAAQMRLVANKLATGNVGRLPAEERFIVLYDSKLHKYSTTTTTTTNNSQQQQQANHNMEESSMQQHQQQQHHQYVWNEVSLYGTRVLIRETRSIRDSFESIFKESQIIIQSVHVDDSARYKCMGLNKAGNTSVEYILRVSPHSSTDSQRNSAQSSATLSPFYHHSPTTRDQRAHTFTNNGVSGGGSTTYGNAVLDAANKARILASQSSQVTGASISSTNPNGTWLKSSRTFQITIVVVSVLMAAVIFAFLLFCIIIYQIKPATTSSTTTTNTTVAGGQVMVTHTDSLSANNNNVVHNNNIPLHSFGEFQLKPQLV